MPQANSTINTSRNRQRDALEAHITRLRDRKAAFEAQLANLPEVYPQVPGSKLSGTSTAPERMEIEKGLKQIAEQEAKIPGITASISQPQPTGGAIDRLQAEIDSMKKAMADMFNSKSKEPNGTVSVSPKAQYSKASK